MKRLVFVIKINRFFVEILFGKQKKVIIFALAIQKYSTLLEKWQSGRLRQS